MHTGGFFASAGQREREPALGEYDQRRRAPRHETGLRALSGYALDGCGGSGFWITQAGTPMGLGDSAGRGVDGSGLRPPL